MEYGVEHNLLQFCIIFFIVDYFQSLLYPKYSMLNVEEFKILS